jgi:hypothetical protein
VVEVEKYIGTVHSDGSFTVLPERPVAIAPNSLELSKSIEPVYGVSLLTSVESTMKLNKGGSKYEDSPERSL